MTKFPFYQQPDQMNCGPTCLRMMAKYYGRSVSLDKLQKLSETTREGSDLQNIADAAEQIGFRTLGVKIDFNKLKEDAPLPCIVHWKQNHFVVVYAIENEKWTINNFLNKLRSFTAGNDQSNNRQSSKLPTLHTVC